VNVSETPLKQKQWRHPQKLQQNFGLPKLNRLNFSPNNGVGRIGLYHGDAVRLSLLSISLLHLLRAPSNDAWCQQKSRKESCEFVWWRVGGRRTKD